MSDKLQRTSSSVSSNSAASQPTRKKAPTPALSKKEEEKNIQALLSLIDEPETPTTNTENSSTSEPMDTENLGDENMEQTKSKVKKGGNVFEKSSASISNREQEELLNSLNFDDLDMTSDDIIFEEMDEDINKFHNDDLVKEALQQGIDPRELSRRIEDDLKTIEIASIDDYLKESDNLAQLHQELSQCDSVLAKMEQTLEKFQDSLGSISEEIRTLQDQSLQMNIKLKNRKLAEEELSKIVNNVMVSPQLVRSICDAEVNEAYLDYILTLNQKVDFIYSNKEGTASPLDPTLSPLDLQAVQDVKPKIDKLCTKATQKIRLFMLQKMGDLKKARTNISMIKQNVLLKFRYFTDFLKKHSNDTAYLELRTQYVGIMSQYYLNSFKTYIQNLCKLEQKVAQPKDLIVEKVETSALGAFGNLFGQGNSTTTSGGLTSSFSALSIFGLGKNTAPTPQQSSSEMQKSSSVGNIAEMSSSKKAATGNTVFACGDRIKVLDNLNVNGTIISHVANEKSQKFLFEEVFRSIHILLINTAVSEYIFTLDFFSEKQETNNQLFKEIFEKALEFFEQTVDAYLSTSFDIVGVMIMIQLAKEFAALMQKRKMRGLETYFDSIIKKLWDRFNIIFDLNMKSIKEANVQQLLPKEKQNHLIIKKYADLTTSLHVLNRDESVKQRIDAYIETLYNAMEKLLDEMATKSGGIQQKVILINSCDIVLNQLISHGVDANAKDRAQFHEKLNATVNAYIGSLLQETFGKLLDYVTRTNGQLSKSASKNQNRQHINPAEMEEIAKDFGKNWTNGLTIIFTNHILKNIVNYATGAEIMKRLAAELSIPYENFITNVHLCFENPPFRQILMGNFRQRIASELSQLLQKHAPSK